ncbi:MAG: cupin domain-containing protein [Candidatus Latescibacteria bacterium]|nr:cupin domain-containing protein [Candidatus Latescibacterota bacterium]
MRSALSTLAFALTLLAVVPVARAADDAAPADSVMRPRLGQGSYLDTRDLSAEPRDLSQDAGEIESFLDSFSKRPPLDFKRLQLQELLRKNLLAEEENSSRVSVFRAESTLALELYQLRGEEWPHYHPHSDLWVYVWRGRGTLLIDDDESEYGPGDLLQIPAGRTYALHNLSGAPTVALLWEWPPVVDELTVEFIPEDVLEQMRLDSLRNVDLQERSLYRSARPGRR